MFIALAEETGLILQLSQWVREAACKQLALRAKQPSLATLKRTSANAHRLKLELTVSLLVFNIEGVVAKMSALKRREAGVSLDDFGTG